MSNAPAGFVTLPKRSTAPPVRGLPLFSGVKETQKSQSPCIAFEAALQALIANGGDPVGGTDSVRDVAHVRGLFACLQWLVRVAGPWKSSLQLLIDSLEDCVFSKLQQPAARQNQSKSSWETRLPYFLLVRALNAARARGDSASTTESLSEDFISNAVEMGVPEDIAAYMQNLPEMEEVEQDNELLARSISMRDHIAALRFAQRTSSDMQDEIMELRAALGGEDEALLESDCSSMYGTYSSSVSRAASAHSGHDMRDGQPSNRSSVAASAHNSVRSATVPTSRSLAGQEFKLQHSGAIEKVDYFNARVDVAQQALLSEYEESVRNVKALQKCRAEMLMDYESSLQLSWGEDISHQTNVRRLYTTNLHSLLEEENEVREHALKLEKKFKQLLESTNGGSTVDRTALTVLRGIEDNPDAITAFSTRVATSDIGHIWRDYKTRGGKLNDTLPRKTPDELQWLFLSYTLWKMRGAADFDIRAGTFLAGFYAWLEHMWGSWGNAMCVAYSTWDSLEESHTAPVARLFVEAARDDACACASLMYIATVSNSAANVHLLSYIMDNDRFIREQISLFLRMCELEPPEKDIGRVLQRHIRAFTTKIAEDLVRGKDARYDQLMTLVAQQGPFSRVSSKTFLDYGKQIFPSDERVLQEMEESFTLLCLLSSYNSNFTVEEGRKATCLCLCSCHLQAAVNVATTARE